MGDNREKLVFGGIEFHQVLFRFSQGFVGLADLLVLMFQKAVGPGFQQVYINHDHNGTGHQNFQKDKPP